MSVTDVEADEPRVQHAPSMWVDRADEANELASFIRKTAAGLVVLYGRYAVGKTTLIRRYLMPILEEDYEVSFEDASTAADKGVEAAEGRIPLRDALLEHRIVFLDRFERYLAGLDDKGDSLRSMAEFLRSPERQGVLVLIMDDAGLEKIIAAAAWYF